MNRIAHTLLATVLVLLSGCRSFPLRGDTHEPVDQQVTVTGKDFMLRATDKIAWAEPVYNFDHTVAYAVKLDKNSEGWGPNSVTKITQKGITDPFIASGEMTAGDVRFIMNVSDDGRKLRVMLQFEKVRKGSGMYGMRPVILDTVTREITESGF